MHPKNRRPLDSERAAVVIVGIDNIPGLQTARIFAAHSVPVIGLAQRARHPFCSTNTCVRVITADTTGPEVIAALLTLAAELQRRAVIVCCTDAAVQTISSHREVLEEHFYVALPDADALEVLMDKTRFYAFAQQHHLPIPATEYLNSAVDVERVAREFRFPLIAKPPMQTPEWTRAGGEKTYRIKDPIELCRVFAATRSLPDRLLVQEYIPGPDSELYSCNCYFDQTHRPVVTFVARKLRQWPPGAGVSSLGEACRNEVVREQTLKLFSLARLWGLGYLEMKFDARTGKHYMIEPNVGRPTGRSAIAEANGVELLYAMYCDLLGLPLPEHLEQSDSDVKWMYFRRDVASAFYYWRHGELTLAEWVRSWRGKKFDAVFSWGDQVPFWLDVQDAAFHALSRLRHTRHA